MKYIKKLTTKELAETFPEFYYDAIKRIKAIKRDLPYKKAFKRINNYHIPEETRSFLKLIWTTEMDQDDRIKEIDRLTRFVNMIESIQKGTDKKELNIELAKMTPIQDLYSFEKVKIFHKKTKACCPFHNEKTPSFFIYHETNSFYCFSCHTGGDVIRFLMLLEGLNFPEAVKRLGG